jgi:hypothetical protein
MQFTDKDQAALRKLDPDVEINANGTATISGEMHVEITRHEDRFQVKFTFPNGGQQLDVAIRHSQLLRELGIENGES